VALIQPAVGTKGRRTHRSLVEATRAVVTETGGFNAEAVAERAGVAPATFYVYFPSKDEALGAALDDVLHELIGRTLGAFTLERILDDGLRAAVEAAVDEALAVFTSSAVVMRLALARLPESRTIRHVYRDHQRRAAAELQRVLERAAKAGHVTGDDAASLTPALMVFLQGLNNPVLLGRARDDRVVAHLVDAAVHLLEPAP
jgi:AcrR family transcriptional regulator